MIDKEQENKKWEEFLQFRNNFLALVDKKETPETCEELEKLLLNSISSSASAVVTVEVSTKREETLSLQLSIASFAILKNKNEFFNIIIDKYPGLMFVNPYLASQPPIYLGSVVTEYFVSKHETPLKLAVRMCNPALVSTILSSPHFIYDKVNNRERHIAYVNACKKFAEASYPQSHTALQIEVLKLLETEISR